MIHGDLKGVRHEGLILRLANNQQANILVGKDGIVRICDFGLASILAEHAAAPTSQTTMRGTCRWMAPELFNDDPARHTVYSDVWSLGCVILEVRRVTLDYMCHSYVRE